MLEKIIRYSIRNKLIIILFTLTITVFGLYSVFKIPVGAVPDITNNQVQVITTSSNLSTQEIEQFITAPVEIEMANLPGVKEIRSVSKFGISLVTIVFEESLGTYLPRMLIAEKIKSASEKIPEGYGTPEMGPITTGLGEIYQYTLEVDSAYQGRYTATDLRTIQDWIIKRRLSGIKGVVEINSWGGYLKQYEVAVDPAALSSYNISLIEVYNAISSNNNITGGSYIEKTNQSYFIRGDGQTKSLQDIENIQIRNNNGIAVLVKDVAKVGFGHANRFGAITANGKGETILGQVMMLKNANSKEVIADVKTRIEEVQKNLPEGIHINPIVDRSILVEKTTFTVIENLLIGAIIVMLTVMLLLGNIRLALVITSIIPLALLFTISMMFILGIDANLMSLGALDFGIIIDGAVIIVEFIALKMIHVQDEYQHAEKDHRKTLMNRISAEGASKMMKSALFGQIIILIVFIPILSLTGVEGKMFRPMALSFCFAILGAIIFGLTWLPVASSLFIKPHKKKSNQLSDKIMKLAHKLYQPSLMWSFKHKKFVLGTSLLVLVLTVLLFTRMGGEFVPTLDEGDFVVQPVLKTGTSLSKTIETTTKMEKILFEKIPEVEKVVSRIGAAEVPTDPMSMEEIDMIIKLKPKKDWVTAKTKEDLAEKINEALQAIPGVEYEFTQPIEMRFNELITGVRSDIAIKIFGEDLEYINTKAYEIKKNIENIPGAGDVILEKTDGLPQIRIIYDREKLHRYNVDIKTLNHYISSAFGGEKAGVIFEGEKSFDMVMRLDKTNRTDISDIRELKVPVNNNMLIPLTELTDIQYSEGPAKISRENTHRRVVVSVNVRNRDLQSVVNDIREKIEKNVTLKPGNYISYGGQFENLQNASKRLMIAVPISLLLIFVFLHFAFKSLRIAFMIFTAIPLATVGGVLFLWIRDMPFSISAGVGFIALFGIAVLNGIVLIERFRELSHEGNHDMRELIMRGTNERLRPVLLTASAAAMGFLPMAISSGAGAEVQRPLATVVIGGIITSTLLTMIVLPLIYEAIHSIKTIKLYPFKIIRNRKSTLTVLLLIMAGMMLAQSPIKLDDCIRSGMEKNKDLQAAKMKVQEMKSLMGSAFDIDKTFVSYGTDENNIAENGFPLRVWKIEQNIGFPTLYKAVSQSKKTAWQLSQSEYLLLENNTKKELTLAYLDLQKWKKLQKIYENMEVLFSKSLTAINKRYKSGDINKLEWLQMEAKHQQYRNKLFEVNNGIKSAVSLLELISGIENITEISTEKIEILPSDTTSSFAACYRLIEYEIKMATASYKIEVNNMMPDIRLNYFNGTNLNPGAKYYHGFEAGIAVPLFYNAGRSKIKAAKFSQEATTKKAEQRVRKLENKKASLLQMHQYYESLVMNYESRGKVLYDEIIKSSAQSFENGEIDFYKYSNSMETALNLEISFIENLHLYNQYTTELKYLSE